MTRQLTPPEVPAPARVPARASARALWPLHLAGFLAAYLISLPNVALPDIQAGLGVPASASTLVIGAFAAANAAMLIVGGRLGDRLGRRRTLRLGAGALVVASVVTTVAPGIELLVVARVAQGIAIAVMMPQALSTVQAVLDGTDRARGIAVFAGWNGAGSVLGQVIGGLVITALPPGMGWRGAMGTVVVLALAALLGATRLPETHGARDAAFDGGGAGILGAGLLLVISGLSFGPSTGWAPAMPALIAVGVAALALLVVHQRRREARGRAALLPPSVIRLPAVRSGMLLAGTMFAGFAALLYTYAQTTQQFLGMSAAGSGLASAGLMVGFIAVSSLSGRLVGRWGRTRVMTTGGVLQMAGWLALGGIALAAPSDPVWWLQVPLLALGASYGLLYAPLIGAVMAAVPPGVGGLTGGLLSTSQQAGSGIGVAALGGVFVMVQQGATMLAAFGTLSVCLVALGLALTFLAVRLGRR